MTYLTCREAADKLRIRYETMQVLCRQGRVPGAFKLGGQWRVPWPLPLPGAHDEAQADSAP